MKKPFIALSCIIIITSASAQDLKSIPLVPPDRSRGLPAMEAFSLRSSATAWDTAMLNVQDLSDLLWAANGINRPETGKRTAPSAMNAQDIDLYIFLKKGVYLYLADENSLQPVTGGDSRKLVAGRQEEVASVPVIVLMVSDTSRFRAGTATLKLTWAAVDAGTVSQNISIFCAATGLATRPRATMDEDKLRELLKLKKSQIIILNNPVSYKKN